MKPLKLFIKDVEWSFCVLDDKAYEAKHGTSSHGITDKYELTVDFKASSFNKRLVNHEIFHVYVASCCVSSVEELDENSVEEIGAEITEFHLEQMMTITKKLYNSLKVAYDKSIQQEPKDAK
jgi:hypothetical protein